MADPPSTAQTLSPGPRFAVGIDHPPTPSSASPRTADRPLRPAPQGSSGTETGGGAFLSPEPAVHGFPVLC